MNLLSLSLKQVKEMMFIRINEADIDAKFDNGILNITLPKIQGADRSRCIEIN